MSETDNMSQTDGTAKLDSYRNIIFVSYAIAGFIISMMVLYFSLNDMLSEVSTRLAIAFALITTVFTWVGGAIANSVYSLDDSGDPWTHRWAIIKTLPLGGTVIASVVAVVYFAITVPP